MHFKLEYSVTPLIMPEDSPLQLHLGGPHGLRVTIRCPTAEEIGQGYKTTTSICIARSEREPSEHVRRVFEQIDANQIAHPGSENSISCEYTNAKGLRIKIPGPDGFPEFFRSFLTNLRRELSDAAQRAVRILRWRTNEPGPPRPFGARGSSWSFDGEFWHPLPSKTSVQFLGMQATIDLAPSAKDDVLTLLRAGDDEPIYHILFREAWEQRSSNPGSALVIGMTALEVGVKSLIGTLVPHASWLAMQAPTPPLVQILMEYLPMLPAKHVLNGQVKSPPQPIMQDIRKGVSLRNGLAHRGQPPPDFETLESILLAVKDCLWLFDYYAGHVWASKFIRRETLEALSTDDRGGEDR
jgi:hypothetical protein